MTYRLIRYVYRGKGVVFHGPDPRYFLPRFEERYEGAYGWRMPIPEDVCPGWEFWFTEYGEAQARLPQATLDGVPVSWLELTERVAAEQGYPLERYVEEFELDELVYLDAEQAAILRKGA